MNLLEIEDLRVRFGGVTALDGVDLTVADREIVGLIGPNGSGKTTLLNCVTGLVTPAQGRVRVAGVDVATHRAQRPAHERARLGLARTFQTLQLVGRLSVLENLMLAVDARSSGGMLVDALHLPSARFHAHRATEHARAILHLLDLTSVADQPATALSVGIQRRVELGRAIATRPRLLLLDEPAAGLDETETADLAELLTTVRQRLGVAILLIDHDMALVMSVCDRVEVLDFGRRVAGGPPERVQTDPVVIRAYLGEAVA